MSATPLNQGARTAEVGMAIMALVMFLVPIGDTLSKLLTATLDPLEIAFWRFAFQSVALGVLALVLRPKLGGGSPWLLMIGGVASATTLGAFIAAFSVMPVATALAIFFVEPLILTVLAALFLGEKTGWRRYVAVGIGLVGALIVIRPNWSTFGIYSLFPLLAAVSFAVNSIVMRRLSTTMSSIGIQFWTGTIASVCLFSVLLPFGGLDLVGLHGIAADGPWGMLTTIGVLSSLTFFLFAEAFRRTPASTLAPFQYLEIVGATALGYFVFGDFPDFWTWVGTAIILASGLYVFGREREKGQEPESVPVHGME